jgi:hypothetical protein
LLFVKCISLNLKVLDPCFRRDDSIERQIETRILPPVNGKKPLAGGLFQEVL